ncbi:choice-of-anchor H family protein [Lacimicrobium sp. SS2-24]|uniref:choice-of-anchor H family protein n=1 Tax=Lacimicrobium sp. SS2-24 TaxID=2005569 RepID=UPI000B4A84D9|nr:choice-of-anchor H family protein [Lacimicrobium sp. SS2-24]
MKTLTLLALLCMSSVSFAQNWRAESTERPAQQAQENKADAIQSPARATNKTLVSRTQYHGSENIWIYDAWLVLEHDQDRDGYYSDFTLTFDADTAYSGAAVYAVLYLGTEDEFMEYHDSSVFTIYGESSDDTFEVNTQLVEGFASDDYEILIELYDADDHSLVAVYDGYADSDLLYVPLESSDYEYQPTTVVVNAEGGTFGIVALIALLVALVWRKSRR